MGWGEGGKGLANGRVGRAGRSRLVLRIYISPGKKKKNGRAQGVGGQETGCERRGGSRALTRNWTDRRLKSPLPVLKESRWGRPSRG